MSVHPPASPTAPAGLLDLAGPSPHAFLTHAYAWISDGGRDPALVARMIEVLRTLDMGGPARELLAPRFEAAAANVDVEAVRRELRTAPQGRLDWDRQRHVFELNLRALSACHPHVAIDTDAIARLTTRCQLFADATGCHHLSISQFGQVRQWPAGLRASRRPASADLDALEPPRSLVVAGVDLTGFIEHIHAATARDVGHVSPILIVEPNWTLLAAWLHTADLAGLLEDPRVALFVGADAIGALGRMLRAHPEIATPHSIMDAGSGVDVEAIGDEVRNASEALMVEHDERRERIEQRDETRTGRDLLRRVRERRPVLALTSRHTTMLQYALRDMGEALAAMGFAVTLEKERERHHDMNAFVLSQLVDRIDPAFVLVANHLRYECDGYGTCPILTWIQDPVPTVLAKAAGASIGPQDLACGYFTHRCVDEYGYPPDSVYPVAVIPVSTQRFHDGPFPPEETDVYTCDVMYVGNYHETHDELHDRWREKSPPHVHPLLASLRAAVEALLASGGHLVQHLGSSIVAPTTALDDPQRLVEEHAAALGLDVPTMQIESIAYHFVHRLFDLSFRVETLEWVARWARAGGRRFKLWGNGWDRVPELAEFAAGPIEHGEPLRRACRGAKLVIQTIPSGFLHQRSLEATLCGALVLSRYTPSDFQFLTIEAHRAARRPGSLDGGMPSLFEDFERTVFSDAASFAELANRMIDDEAGRCALLAGLEGIVRADFTYDIVAANIVARLEERLARLGE